MSPIIFLCAEGEFLPNPHQHDKFSAENQKIILISRSNRQKKYCAFKVPMFSTTDYFTFYKVAPVLLQDHNFEFAHQFVPAIPDSQLLHTITLSTISCGISKQYWYFNSKGLLWIFPGLRQGRLSTLLKPAVRKTKRGWVLRSAREQTLL